MTEDSHTTVLALATAALVWSEADYGTARQIDAFNALIAHCESVRPDLFKDNTAFEERIVKATSDEIVHAVLERLGVPAERWPWRLGEHAVLPGGYEAYPNFLIQDRLTGTVVDLTNRGFVFVKLDQIRPELEEWENVLHVYEDEAGTTPNMVRARAAHA